MLMAISLHASLGFWVAGAHNSQSYCGIVPLEEHVSGWPKSGVASVSVQVSNTLQFYDQNGSGIDVIQVQGKRRHARPAPDIHMGFSRECTVMQAEVLEVSIDERIEGVC
ncbi:hypothetical protein CLAIMM_14175 [Cladophialophora immunda]|nr:hypothetical protein CLAIMM_14175 [Cladophialophora immunda]